VKCESETTQLYSSFQLKPTNEFTQSLALRNPKFIYIIIYVVYIYIFRFKFVVNDILFCFKVNKVE
jgi:hypothetical protein